MTRIKFEDLPSANTPINAENLNKLNNVIVSSEEPITGEEVWIQRGKNLFDKNNIEEGYELESSTGNSNPATDWYVSNYISIKPNTTYCLSGDKYDGLNNYFYDKQKNFLGVVPARVGVFTSLENAYYMRFNGTLEELNNNIQLEEGEVATSYEEYILKRIYVKNGEKYDAFYSEKSIVKNYLNYVELFDCTFTNQSTLTKDENGIVTINLSLVNNANINANTYVDRIKVPLEIRPKQNVLFYVLSPSDIVLGMGYLQASTGFLRIKFLTQINSGKEINIMTTYKV